MRLRIMARFEGSAKLKTRKSGREYAFKIPVRTAGLQRILQRMRQRDRPPRPVTNVDEVCVGWSTISWIQFQRLVFTRNGFSRALQVRCVRVVFACTLQHSSQRKSKQAASKVFRLEVSNDKNQQADYHKSPSEISMQVGCQTSAKAANVGSEYPQTINVHGCNNVVFDIKWLREPTSVPSCHNLRNASPRVSVVPIPSSAASLRWLRC